MFHHKFKYYLHHADTSRPYLSSNLMLNHQLHPHVELSKLVTLSRAKTELCFFPRKPALCVQVNGNSSFSMPSAKNVTPFTSVSLIITAILSKILPLCLQNVSRSWPPCTPPGCQQNGGSDPPLPELLPWDPNRSSCCSPLPLSPLVPPPLCLSSLCLTHQHNCHWVSVQFSSVPQSCPTLCDPMDGSTPGLPISNSQSLLKLMSIGFRSHPIRMISCYFITSAKRLTPNTVIF